MVARRDTKTRKEKHSISNDKLLQPPPRRLKKKKKKKKTATSSTSKLALAFAASLVVLLVLDGLWINVVSKPLGFDYFGTVEMIQGGQAMAKRPIGLLAYFSMAAACARASERGGAAASAEAGFYIYSIYDFTNTFLFKGWSPALALMDIAWGTSVFAVAGAAATAAVAALL